MIRRRVPLDGVGHLVGEQRQLVDHLGYGLALEGLSVVDRTSGTKP